MRMQRASGGRPEADDRARARGRGGRSHTTRRRRRATAWAHDDTLVGERLQAGGEDSTIGDLGIRGRRLELRQGYCFGELGYG